MQSKVPKSFQCTKYQCCIHIRCTFSFLQQYVKGIFKEIREISKIFSRIYFSNFSIQKSRKNQANNKEFNLLHHHLKRAPFLLYALLWVIFSDLPKVVPCFHKVFLIFVKVHASVHIISNFFLYTYIYNIVGIVKQSPFFTYAYG